MAFVEVTPKSYAYTTGLSKQSPTPQNQGAAGLRRAKHRNQVYTLCLQVPSEKVFGVGARRVQIPSEEVLGGVGIVKKEILMEKRIPQLAGKWRLTMFNLFVFSGVTNSKTS